MVDDKDMFLKFKLIPKKIPIRYSTYEINNVQQKMLNSESIAISIFGILFSSSVELQKRSLLRILIEMPDYWIRKSRLVEYQQTTIPTHFQLLARVLSIEKKSQKHPYKILCENLNIDSVDEIVLHDYLATSTKQIDADST